MPLSKNTASLVAHFSNGKRDMGAMMAMLVHAIIPIIIFYLMCQKHIIEGVVAGAVKG